MKCLVVDDSAVVRRIVISSLKAIGITDVVEAGDGRAAIEKCDASIELVITDWNMPVMGGLELVRSLRAGEATARTPVLMVTSGGADQDVLEGVEAGVNGCILKPFTPAALKEKIDQIIEVLR